MKPIVFALAALSLSCAFPAMAADTLYDNLAAPSDGVSAPNGFNSYIDTFSTGDSGFELESIDALMSAATPEDGGYFQFAILESFGGKIEFVSDEIPDADLLTSLSVIHLYAGALSLAPDTRYEVLMGFYGSAAWSYSGDISGPGVAGEFWSDTGATLVSNSDGHGPFQMAVETPEVSTWAMLLTGFAGLGLAGASRRRRALV